MSESRDRPAVPASREMALAFLSTYLRGARSEAPPPAARAAESTFSPTLQRMAQDRSRQQRREQEARAHQRQIKRSILQHEHRLAELKAQLARAEAFYRELQRDS